MRNFGSESHIVGFPQRKRRGLNLFKVKTNLGLLFLSTAIIKCVLVCFWGIHRATLTSSNNSFQLSKAALCMCVYACIYVYMCV